MPKEKRKRRKERDELINTGKLPADQPYTTESKSGGKGGFDIDPNLMSDEDYEDDDEDTKTKQESNTPMGRLKRTTTTRAPQSSAPAPAFAASSVGRALSSSRRQRMPNVEWKYVLFGGAAVMFLAFFTHLFSTNGGIVLNDRASLGYLFSTETVKQLAETSMNDLISRPMTMPWTKASLLTDRGDWQLQWTFYHMSNVLMHMAATGYFFVFLVRFGRHLAYQNRLSVNPYFLAIGAAAIFACHPLTSQTVSYLSARGALLGTLNYFLFLNCLLIGLLAENPFVKWGGYVVAAMAGMMAIWSNPEMVSLPIVGLFTIIMLRGPLHDAVASAKQNPFASSLLLLAAIASPGFILGGLEHPDALDLTLPMPTAVGYYASQIKGFVFYYLRALFVPFGLSIDPPAATATSFTDPYVLGAIAIFAALIGLLWKFRPNAIVGYGLALMAAGFVPHALMLQKDQVADWVAYLPLGGAAIIMSWGLCKLAAVDIKKATIAFAGAIVLFTGLSIWRDIQWSSNMELWTTALQQRPKSARAHANVALELVKRKDLTEAEKEAKLAIAFDPSSVQARIAEGRVLMAQGKFADAEKSFTAASDLATSQALPQAVQTDARFGIVESMIRGGRGKDTAVLYDKLFQESPNDPRLFYLLAVASQSMGIERSYRFLRSAIQVDPTFVEALEMASTLAFNAGVFENAYVDSKSWQTAADSRDSRMMLARSSFMTKRLTEAEAMAKKMIQSNPKDAEALLFLSRLYKHNNRLSEADKYKMMAIEIEPKIEEKFPMPELSRLPEPAPEKPKTRTTPTSAPSETPAPAPAPESSSTGTSTTTEAKSTESKPEPATPESSSSTSAPGATAPAPAAKPAATSESKPAATSESKPAATSAPKAAPATSESKPVPATGAAKPAPNTTAKPAPAASAKPAPATTAKPAPATAKTAPAGSKTKPAASPSKPAASATKSTSAPKGKAKGGETK